MGNTMYLERKFAAWLAGKEDKDCGREPSPPRWVRESSSLIRFYDSGYYGEDYN